MPWKPLTHSERQRAANDKIRNAAYDTRRGVEHTLRKSGRYIRFRGWYMKQHPLCADPFNEHKQDGVTVGSVQLHHKKKVKDNPELLCDELNAMALCTACHAKISAIERK